MYVLASPQMRLRGKNWQKNKQILYSSQRLKWPVLEKKAQPNAIVNQQDLNDSSGLLHPTE